MKKNIIYALITIITIFILSSCGADSKTDGDVGSTITGNVISKIDKVLVDENSTMNFGIKVSSTYNNGIVSKLSNLNLLLEGCTIVDGTVTANPSSVVIDSTTVSKSIFFTAKVTEPTCTATAYEVTATETLTSDGQEYSHAFTTGMKPTGLVDANASITEDKTTVDDRNYSFSNIPFPILIDKAEQEYPIKLQLIDSNNEVVSGKEVVIESYDIRFGVLDVMSATTDASGFATFIFTSPVSLNAIDGLTIILKSAHTTDKGDRLTANITLFFNASQIVPNLYKFTNASSLVTITPATEQEITIDLINDKGIGVSGESISITNISSSFGSFSSSSASTDSAGRATFIFTSADNLSSVDNQSTQATLSYIDESGNTLSSTISISINTSLIPSLAYTLVNETTPITITTPAQVSTISVNVVDSFGVGVLGKVVQASTPIWGTLSSATASTDSAGKASFTYTAPSDLTGFTPILINLIFTENGVTLTKSIVINSTTIPTPIDTFILVNENNITINYASQTKEIAVQVIKNGVPVVGESVTAKSIPISFGRIENITVTTGSDGYARFNYIAPDTLTNGTQPIILLHTDIDKVEATATATLTVAKIDYSNYSITVIPTDINITLPEEFKVVSVYVNDNNNRPAKDITVSIDYFNQVLGVMDKYSGITDINGHIDFNYVAPSNIDSLDGNTSHFDMYLNADTSIRESVNLSFSKSVTLIEVADIYINPSTLKVIQANEVKKVKITAVDVKNFGVSTKFKIQNPALTSTDYGSFDVNEFTTDSLGNFEVTYTAPADIGGLADRNISIIELETNIERILTLTFQQPNSQEILYDLNLSVDNKIEVDGTGTFGITIRESGNPDTYIDKINVIDVNASMEFPTMLSFASNAPTINYSGKSANSYKVYAKQFSGVAIINVSATIFDGVNNVTLTQRFPVVILSGALSSMSMFHSRNSFDVNTGLYKDYYTIHAVDKYGNPIQSGTALHPSLINNVKAEGHTGSITPSIFTDTNANFNNSNIVDTEDRIIILPSSSSTSKYAIGDWSINTHTNTTLSLAELYGDVNIPAGLSYVVGNENGFAQDKIAIADISGENNVYLTDSQGNAEFVVTYDPALKGEIYYLAANGGSEGKRIGTALKSSFYYGGYQLRTLMQDMYVYSGGETFLTGFYMLDSVGQLTSENYNVRMENFDNPGGYSIDNGAKEFTYSAPSDISSLIGTTYEFNLTISEGKEPYQTIKIHYIDDTNYTNYKLISNENNFTITQPNETHKLNLYLRDGNSVVANQDVSIDLIDPSKGTIDTYTYPTNSNGYVYFLYTAPEELSLLYNTNLTIRAYLTANPAIDVNITASFSPVQEVDTTNYNLVAVPSSANISPTDTNKVLDLYLSDSNSSQPVVNQTIIAHVFDPNSGTLDKYTDVTDANGHIVFNYIPSTTLPSTDLNITFEVPGASIPKTANIILKFTANSNPTGDYSSYNFSVIPIESNIITAGETKIIKAFVGNGVRPVEGETVLVDFTDDTKGRMSSFSAVTDVNGHAIFNYTAPDDISTLIDKNITISFRMENNTSKEANSIINFVSPGTVTNEVNTTNLNLIALPTAINISIDDTSRVLDLYLENNSTNAPVADTVIVAKFINPSNGTLEQYTATTDNAGHVAFNYTRPDSISIGSDFNISFDISSASVSREANVTVNFVAAGTVTNEVNTTNLQLIALPTNINISTDDTSRVLDLYLE
ncbi:MAG: hypothetical protein QM493_07470, partial [Sulfurovum sp.]